MKIRYKGPGASVTLDGLEVKKNELTEVTHDQYRRIRDSDPAAVVDVEDESTKDDAKVLEKQTRAAGKKGAE